MNKPTAVSKRVLVALALMASFLAPIVLSQSPASAAACDDTWTGATSTTWATGTNWSLGAAPTSVQNACVPGGLAHEPVVAASTTVNSVTTSANGSVGMSGPFTVLTLTSNSTIENLTLGSLDTVTTNGVLTVSKSFALTGSASISGSGSLVTTGDVAISGGGNTLGVNWTQQADQDTTTFDFNGSLSTGSHTITVPDGSVFDTSDATGTPAITTAGLISTGGALYLTGVNISGPVTLDNGLLDFDKTIAGNVTATGGTTIEVGDFGTPAVTASVTGTFTQTEGQINFTVNGPGTAGTNYDRLNVSGALTLSGDVQLGLDNSNHYVGTANDAFDLIHAASISGGYDPSVNTDFTNTALGAIATYSATDVTATVVPTPGSIEGFVYQDDNANGTLESSEQTPVEGVTVYDDLNNNGTKDAGEPSYVTSSSGEYSIDGASVGTAHLRIVTPLPAGFVASTAVPLIATVTTGATTSNNNIGLYEHPSISGTVFTDTDGDGLQDNSETGIAGVTVYLDANNNGTLDSGEVSQTTASNGTYSFTGLTSASNPVRVAAVPPSGLLLTTGDPQPFTTISGDEITGNDIGFNTTGPAQGFGGGIANDPSSQGTGYWLVGANGSIYSFGSATNLGSPSTLKLNAPIVGLTPNPQGDGYWAVGSDGGVFAYGTSGFYGSAGGAKLNQPVDGIAATPDGGGYWLVAKDGGVFAYGDAGFYGSAGGAKLNQPIVGIATTPDGGGYWLVAKDGGVFAYGDAGFYGSMGGKHLASPIVGIAAGATGQGYTLVAADGGVFAFGEAQYYGSANTLKLKSPIVSIKAVGDGSGYWLIGADGGVFAYGSAGFFGTPPTVTSPVAQ